MVSETRPDRSARVLHALRCMGAAGIERISDGSGITGREVEHSLEQLAGEGMVAFTPGPFGGWSVTDAGRSADDDWLSGELDVLAARDFVHDYYERFLTLNPELLRICSDWQMRRFGDTPTLNDHTDPDYDAAVLSRLVRLDESAQDLCAELAGRADRFAVYRGRLSSALDQAMAGNHDYVADRLDSYHTIWFQLHEDLLTTLGISREDERRKHDGG